MKENETSLCMEYSLFNAIAEKYEDELYELLEEKYKIIEMKHLNWILFINRENFDKINELVENEIIEEESYV